MAPKLNSAKAEKIGSSKPDGKGQVPKSGLSQANGLQLVPVY